MGRPISDIKRELKYLELKYKLLQIKTIPYRETKAKLEKELAKEVEKVNKGEAKELSGYKPSTRPSFQGDLNDINEGSKYPRSINSEDEYQSDIKSDIRI